MNLAGGGGLLRLDPTDGSTVSGGLDGEATAAVAVAGGQVRWTAEVGAPLSAPAVARDTILVAAGDGRLVAFAAGGCSASPVPPALGGDAPDQLGRAARRRR